MVTIKRKDESKMSKERLVFHLTVCVCMAVIFVCIVKTFDFVRDPATTTLTSPISTHSDPKSFRSPRVMEEKLEGEGKYKASDSTVQLPVNKTEENDTLLRALGADLGAVQLTRGHLDAVVSIIEEARVYIQEEHPEARDSCFLRHVECGLWALHGGCDENDDALDPKRMIELCAPVCKACGLRTAWTTDTRPSEAEARARALGADLGVVQAVLSDQLEAVLEKVEEGRLYKKQVLEDPILQKVRDFCINQDESCTLRSIRGECGAWNTQSMCPVACKSCDQLDSEIRCRLDPNGTDALGAWDLNSLFERVITDPHYQQFEPVVLSRPWYSPWDTPDNATYKIGLWLVQFDNVLTHEEANGLIELGEKMGYEASEVIRLGSVAKSTRRTSFNTWCQDECYDDPINQRMLRIIENLTGIPESNYEPTQLPRYLPGQHYAEHNDYIPKHQFLPMGPRVLTFYVYLNAVEEGGGTEFPKVGLTVQPKPGRAILWPLVDAEFPTTMDPRSRHAALSVIKGVKYGANIWIHQRNFKSASEKMCL